MAFLDELAVYGDKITIWPQDEKGLLDLDGLLGRPRPDTKVYCCGPEPLLNAVEQRCVLAQGSLHVERFVAKPLTEPVLQGRHLRFTSRGATSPSPFQPTSLS